MKKKLFTFFLLCSCFYSKAQVTFQKAFGGTGYDGAYCAKQTSDGGYILTGITQSFGSGDDQIYLIKTDADGNTIWTKTYGGGFSEYTATYVEQTSDSGYIITGSVMTSLYSLFLLKTDMNGNPVWITSVGGSLISYGSSCQQTSDGRYIVCGQKENAVTQSMDVFLMKSDTSGAIIWGKIYGGLGEDMGTFAQQTSDSGYIISGYTQSFGAGDKDVYLIKTDENGDTMWTKTYGGSIDDQGLYVQQTSDGGYIISGRTQFGIGFYNAYLIKTDASGNMLWTKTLGGTVEEGANAIQQTTDGGYIFTGLTQSFGTGDYDIYLAKCDSNGDTVWTKKIGGSSLEYGFSVQQTTDGGFIIGGMTFSFGSGSSDIYLVKTDANGNSGCNTGNTATITSTPPTQVLGTSTMTAVAGSSIGLVPTVGSGGVVTSLCTNVGINEITRDRSCLIFPNPSSGNFVIAFEGTIMNGKVEILNIIGKSIFVENITTNQKSEITIKNLSQGIYFAKVFDGEKSYCKKIIVE